MNCIWALLPCDLWYIWGHTLPKMTEQVLTRRRRRAVWGNIEISNSAGSTQSISSPVCRVKSWYFDPVGENALRRLLFNWEARFCQIQPLREKPSETKAGDNWNASVLQRGGCPHFSLNDIHLYAREADKLERWQKGPPESDGWANKGGAEPA